jgi:hypothetical protein
MDYSDDGRIQSILTSQIKSAPVIFSNVPRQVYAPPVQVVTQASKASLHRDYPSSIPGTQSDAQRHNEERKVLHRTFTYTRDGGLKPAYVTPHDWEVQKAELRRLYLAENNTLQQTRQIMIQRGFKAR